MSSGSSRSERNPTSLHATTHHCQLFPKEKRSKVRRSYLLVISWSYLHRRSSSSVCAVFSAGEANNKHTNFQLISQYNIHVCVCVSAGGTTLQLFPYWLFNRLEIKSNSYSTSCCLKHLHECRTLIFSSASESLPAKVTSVLSSSLQVTHFCQLLQHIRATRSELQ